jgi:acyl carrier protein
MIFETVKEILARQLEVRPEDIKWDTDIIEDLGADSLDIVELVMSIEEEYDIVVKDESVGNMTTVGQIVDFLEKTLK